MKIKKKKPFAIRIIFYLTTLMVIINSIQLIFFSYEVIITDDISEKVFSESPTSTQELKEIMAIMGGVFNDQNIKIIIISAFLFFLIFYLLLFVLIYHFYNAKNWARRLFLIFSYFMVFI